MMSYSQQALQLADTINPGDCVYIKGALCNHRLVEDLTLRAWQKGALPYFSISSFAFNNALIYDDRISSESLRFLPPALLEFARNTDHLVIIEPLEDPLAQVFDPEKKRALDSARKQFHSKIKHVHVIHSSPDHSSQPSQFSDPSFFSNDLISIIKIRQVATVFIDALRLNRNEFISIKGGLHAQRLLEEISLEGMRRGIHSLVQFTSDYYKTRFLGDPRIKSDTIKIPHAHETALMLHIDARILIDPVEDPAYLNQIPTEIDLQERNTNLVSSREQWLNITRQKKYIYSAYPTKSQARLFDVDYNDLQQTIIDGICSTEGVKIITRTIANSLIHAKKIHVKDDLGTDFWVSVEDRPMFVDDGEITPTQRYLNFPCGEVAFPVHETKGEGILFCPTAEDFITRKKIDSLMIPFKDGKLILDGIVSYNKKHQAFFIKGLKECIKQDKEQGFHPIRTVTLAELGIGTNNGIHESSGNLIDEKMLGTVHLAIGTNTFFGGTSRSILHMDFVTAKGVTIDVSYKDGTKKMICEKGRYLF